MLVLVGQIENHESVSWDEEHMNPNEVVEYPPGGRILDTFAFLGIGAEERKTVRGVATHSSSTERIQGQSVTIGLFIRTEGDEVFRVKPYYDRLFGTVAFWTPQIRPESL